MIFFFDYFLLWRQKISGNYSNIVDVSRPRDGQYRDTCIGDAYRAILLYRYRHRLSVSLQYRVSVSIKHVFVHRRYKYLDTVFEQDQSYHVLTACSTVSEECEMKLNSLIDSKRRTVRKFPMSLAYLQLFRIDIERR